MLMEQFKKDFNKRCERRDISHSISLTNKDCEKLYIGLIAFYCFSLKYYDGHMLACSVHSGEAGTWIYFSSQNRGRYPILKNCKEQSCFEETKMSNFGNFFTHVYTISTLKGDKNDGLLRKFLEEMSLFEEENMWEEFSSSFYDFLELTRHMDLVKLMLLAKRSFMEIGGVSKISCDCVEVFFPHRQEFQAEKSIH